MAKQKILVIDDEVDIARLVVDLLQEEDYTAQAVHTGEEGLKKVKQIWPDLILLDWQLPDIEGVDICRILKNDPETMHIPVIMLTSLSSESHKIRGLETGADDYVTKPFSTGELLARVKVILRRTKREERVVESQIAHLQKFLPKEMIEKILSGPRAQEGERRIVTILLADLSGFTSLSEHMDPEEVTNIINECFKSLVQIIYNYGGTIDKFMGDAIMALFGVPTTHEDDPERALLAALQMRAALDKFNQEKKLPTGPLKMRIGINTGEVVAGSVGSDMHLEYTVMGDAVNVTSRLQATAQPGQIHVSGEVYNNAKDRFDFNKLPAVVFKGKTEPIEVYELLARKKVLKFFNEIVSGKMTNFVDRNREYNFLKGFIDRLDTASQGNIVSIFGDYGVGKSRLCYELLRYALTKNVYCIGIWCLAYGDDLIAYNYTDRQYITKENISSTIISLSDKKPAIVIIEDLDNLSNMNILQQIVPEVEKRRILFLCTHTATFVPLWLDKTYFRQIEIAPLTPDDSRNMLDSILGEGNFTTKSAIINKAEGIPLYIEEILKHLIQKGILKEMDSGWSVTNEIAEIGTPQKIYAIAMSQIDKLKPKTKEILQYAAAIGREFRYNLLKLLVKNEDELRDELTTLKKAGIIVEESTMKERVFKFKYAITREVTFNTLLHTKREELKKKIDKFIETETTFLE